MTLLILGLLLWWGAHLFKRIAPSARLSMTERMGPASKGIFAAAIAVSIVLMVIGYKQAPFDPVYTLPPFAVHINNLLMVFSVLLIGMGSSKGKMRSWFRHPMLMGMIVWVVAHLLVKGDIASIVLFGGLGIWAVVSILIINARDPWTRPEPGPIARDVRLVVISAVVFIVITAIHSMVGPSPFGGGM